MGENMINEMKGFKVSSPYGLRKSPINGKEEFHTGIDLVKPAFSDIKAFVSGTVVHAKMGMKGSGVGGFGVTVIVQDKYDYFHLYAHLTDCCVKVNQLIQSGQVVGRQGSTGQSTGQHLHYEVRSFGYGFGFQNHVDPVKYLDDYFKRETKSGHQPVKKPTNGDDVVLKLDQWQFDMLVKALTELKEKGFLTDDTWVQKAKSKTLTESELSFINTIIIQRKLVGGQ